MQREEVLKEFQQAQAILKGHFLLSSGLHSDTYLQCARVLMDTKRSDRLCAALADKIKSATDISKIDMVVAPAMGGVVVGYEMGRQLDIPTIFCERVDGKFTLRRGFALPENANILLIEDVVTTGKSSMEAADCLNEYGANIIAEGCLIDRSNGDAKLDFPLVSLLEVEVKSYSEDNLPDHLKGTPAIKPGSRGLK
jgi:orotate phosphoribosyltransferase